MKISGSAHAQSSAFQPEIKKSYNRIQDPFPYCDYPHHHVYMSIILQTMRATGLLDISVRNPHTYDKFTSFEVAIQVSDQKLSTLKH